MKRILNLAIVFAVILMLVGCGDDIVLDAPDVTYTVSATDEGGTLVLNWIMIADADGYYIYADGVVIDTIDDATTITYTATTPAAVYGVSAYSGDDVSGTDEIDCTPVVTTGLDVWDISEPPPNPSGFGFAASGTASAYAVTDTANHPLIDYYIESGPQQFWSPHHGNYNNEVNATVNSESTNFDACTIADAPGNYSTQTDIASSAVYYFFIDPTNNGWDDATDYFGKIVVTAVSGTQITMTLAYQPIAGLRWCVTD
jgi:hypothetical protein